MEDSALAGNMGALVMDYAKYVHPHVLHVINYLLLVVRVLRDFYLVVLLFYVLHVILHALLVTELQALHVWNVLMDYFYQVQHVYLVALPTDFIQILV